MGLLIVLALYSLAILVLVPLEKIGKVQTAVRTKIKQWANKIGD